MSIRYGRSLPKSPRPKPPQPRLGEVGPARDLIRAQRKRKKKKQVSTVHSSASQDSQPTSKDAHQQTETKKKKKAKPIRSKQNTPVKVEVVSPKRSSSIGGLDGSTMSCRVVVEWRRDGRRYLAWGKLGVKKVDGRKECTADPVYQQLLKKLRPIGTKLSITDTRIPVVEILDLMIAAGKVLKPRQIFTSGRSSAEKPLSSRPTQRRSRSCSPTNQVTRQRRSAAVEAARNEALVIRPIDGQPSTAARRRQGSRQAANDAQKRKQMLARQRRELRRLSWLRRHGYEQRDAPNDMMHFALQGGSPGLKS